MHIVAFLEDPNDKEQLKKLKTFRKMNQMSITKMFNTKYWIVKDKQLAAQFGIDTDKESVGNIYLLRKQSAFTEDLKPNVNISGYPFVSEKILDKFEPQ